MQLDGVGFLKTFHLLLLRLLQFTCGKTPVKRLLLQQLPQPTTYGSFKGRTQCCVWVFDAASLGLVACVFLAFFWTPLLLFAAVLWFRVCLRENEFVKSGLFRFFSLTVLILAYLVTPQAPTPKMFLFSFVDDLELICTLRYKTHSRYNNNNIYININTKAYFLSLSLSQG